VFREDSTKKQTNKQTNKHTINIPVCGVFFEILETHLSPSIASYTSLDQKSFLWLFCILSQLTRNARQVIDVSKIKNRLLITRMKNEKRKLPLPASPVK